MKHMERKTGDWLLKKHEVRLKHYLVPIVPRWLQTYHLTMMTLVWSVLMVYFFHLGRTDYNFIQWGVPFLVVIQYITDLLDGEVGRRRKTGLVKWGYYADHFLDFVFVSSIIAGYGLVFGYNVWLFAIFAISAGHFVNAYLLVTASDEFKISFLRIGPTEARIIFIVLHFAIAMKDIFILKAILPYLVVMDGFMLAVLFLINLRILWKKDMLLKD